MMKPSQGTEAEMSLCYVGKGGEVVVSVKTLLLEKGNGKEAEDYAEIDIGNERVMQVIFGAAGFEGCFSCCPAGVCLWSAGAEWGRKVHIDENVFGADETGRG